MGGQVRRVGGASEEGGGYCIVHIYHQIVKFRQIFVYLLVQVKSKDLIWLSHWPRTCPEIEKHFKGPLEQYSR